MNKTSYFSGTVALGFGGYFLLQQYQLSPFDNFYTWPTLLVIIGLGFLINGYLGKEYEMILPGVILTGIGFHFHVANRLEVWPNYIGIFLLLIAVGLLLKNIKTGNGLFQGILFLVSSILLLFLDKIQSWSAHYINNLSIIEKGWPYLLIVAGVYLLIAKRK
ncbi:LiaI-LiaF-like domain-containing protein [Bacillus niameyensis]|uniref:LiaI-LiaF-like domain-containing protein n=1 Tax=Bacillus niameyensis TaxID=1522308 RepID=UPI000785964B|nr:DUF5668 domain-containing protein [Bacillus niameyensis]